VFDALRNPESDSGIRDGGALKRFAREATLLTADLPDARMALAVAMGEAGVRQAAMTVAAFSGLVRVADATGIQVDDTTYAITVDERAVLGIDEYNSAANTHVDASTITTPGRFETAYDLFR
jgi:hypothetical protein